MKNCKGKGLGLFAAVACGSLWLMGAPVQADDGVNVVDFRAKKKADARSGFIPADEHELEQASKALLAEEEELLRKLATQGEEAGSARQPKAARPSANDLQEALEREKAILAGLEGEIVPAAAKKSEPKHEAAPKQVNPPSVKAETAASKAEPKATAVKLSEPLKKQEKSLQALQASKARISTKISKAEGRIQELLEQLEETQNRLMLAETEVERLNQVIEARNIRNLERYAPGSFGGESRSALRDAKVVDQFGDKEITTDMPIATITARKANLRTGPGLDNSPLMTVSRGTRLAVETRRGEWYRVIAPSGTRAWVSADVIRFGKTSHSSPTRTIQVKGFDEDVEEQAVHLIKRSS